MPRTRATSGQNRTVLALFDWTIPRHDRSGRRDTESPFQYLTRAATHRAHRDRQLLESLYAGFPDPLGQLRGTLTSRGRSADRHFWGAVTAMQLHRYYSRQLGCQCEVDEASSAVGHRPDLLITASRARHLAVEVTTLGEPSTHQAHRRQHSRLVTELETRVDLRGYLVEVTQLPRPELNLPFKALASELQLAIAALPNSRTQPPRVMRELTVGRAPAEIQVSIVKGIHWGRLTHRVLVTADHGWAWPGRRVRQRLNEKLPSSKDVDESVPYLLVLATRLPDVWIDDVAQALYGVPQARDKMEPGFLTANRHVTGVLWLPTCDLRPNLSRRAVFFANWSTILALDLDLVPWWLRAIPTSRYPLADHITFESREGSAVSLSRARELVRPLVRTF
jgi:hypothetical protein